MKIYLFLKNGVKFLSKKKELLNKFKNIKDL